MGLLMQLLVLDNHPVKSTGHRHCGSEDMFLICFMIFQEYLIKGSCDFMSGSSSLCVSILPSLGAICIVLVEVWCFYYFYWKNKSPYSCIFLPLLFFLKHMAFLTLTHELLGQLNTFHPKLFQWVQWHYPDTGHTRIYIYIILYYIILYIYHTIHKCEQIFASPSKNTDEEKK